MKLSELLKELALGELSSMAFSQTGTVKDDSHPKVITAINAALTDMYSRIHLLEREVIVQTLEWKSLYYLRPEFAQMSNSNERYKYIIDTPANPFTGDLVKILGVTNERGDPLPMNDAEQWASVFTPHFDAVQFNHPGYNQVFLVQYQALHPVLKSDGEGYLDQKILVPSVMLEMLRIKTAANIYSPMSGQEYAAKTQALEAAYEMRHNDILQRNQVGDSGVNTNIKLHRRGFC